MPEIVRESLRECIHLQHERKGWNVLRVKVQFCAHSMREVVIYA